MAEDDDKIIPVKVAVRVRPFVQKEIDQAAQSCVQCYVQENQLSINDHWFSYDYVFDPSASQESVYDACASSLLDKLFKGYNCTVFAYGQTGSGKTFTMGTEETVQSLQTDSRGIIPRLVEEMFLRINAETLDYSFTVKCSMLEIYEERVWDLLGDAEKEPLHIRENQKEGVFVQHLSDHAVGSADATMKQLERGCQIRSKGETAMNLKSSRSHAVFTVILQKSAADGCKSKLHLVDLAGSERLKKTQATGSRMKEGIKINEGLLALGNVISALTDSSQRSHIPYRDSKLTRLLQDSLGGNSHTVMVACVSPADSNCEETLSTLRYAERAKKIKNNPVVNRDPNAAEIVFLRGEVQRLTREILHCKTGETPIPMNPLRNGQTDAKILADARARENELAAENMRLAAHLAETVAEKALLTEKLFMSEFHRDKLREKIKTLTEKLGANISTLESSGYVDYPDKDRQLMFMKELEHELPLLGQLDSEPTELNTTYNKREWVEGEEEGEGEEEEEEDYQEKFVERQSKVSRQIEQLLDQIREKERLVEQTAATHQQIEQMRTQHEKEMDDLQLRITALQKQKDELNQLLKRVENSSKVSEERRKKLQELEKELQDSRKKLTELQKLQKLKVQSDLSVQKLREEIQGLKQMRVKLVKTLREESEKFRQWKMKCEREMNQLKMKDKKREFAVQQQKRNFDQQLTVYRRKYEEAVSFGKRLQQQLQRQNLNRTGKFTEMQDNDKLIAEIKTYLDHELELVVSTEEARLHCDSLIQQRTELNRELSRLRRQYKTAKSERETSRPPAKKQNLGSGRSSESGIDDADRLEKAIADVQEEIDLRNAEIKELQLKMGSFDAETKASQRWAAVFTTTHAKCALKLLFDMAVAARMDCVQAEAAADEVKNYKTELTTHLKQRETELEECRKQLEQERADTEQKLDHAHLDAQTKICFLLTQLCKLVKGDQLDEEDIQKALRLKDSLEQVQGLQEALQKEMSQNKHLLEELSRARVKGGRGKLFSSISSSELGDGLELERSQSLKRSRSSRVLRPVQRLGRPVDSSKLLHTPSAESEGEEEDEDSDYRETPVGQRLLKLTTQSKDKSGSYCRCKGACNKGQCGCVKRKESCGDACICSGNTCQNRTFETEAKPTADTVVGRKDPLDTTFVLLQTSPPSSQSSQSSQSSAEERRATVADASSASPLLSSGLARVRTTTPAKRFFAPLTDTH